MNEPRLNVTFGYSAADSLKLALQRVKRSEEVAALIDDFTMGPLNPGDAEQRAEWARQELRDDDPIANSEAVEEFWKKVSSCSGRLVVWMSSRCARELCGLRELLWRLPHASVHLIDVAAVGRGPTTTYDDAQAFASMRDERVVELGLVDSAKPIDDLQRASYRKRWQQLRQERAPA